MRRRPLPRGAVLAAAISLLVTVGLLTYEDQSSPAPTAVAGDVDLATADDATCDYLDPADRDLRVMFVGDSMTQGRSGSATYRYWVWRGLGQERDDVEFVGPQTSLNGSALEAAYEHLDHGFDQHLEHAAQSGSTFESIQAAFPVAQTIREHRPDVVVLQLGFNDSNRKKTTPEQLAASTDDYVQAVWAADDELGRERTRFVLGQIPPAERGSTDVTTRDRNRRTEAANELIGRQWRSQPCQVQVNRLRSSTELSWSPSEHTYDGDHPDAAGETLVADRMLASMGRLGVFRGEVEVFDAAEPWTPEPRIAAGVLADNQVRVTWEAERERISATRVRLRIATGDRVSRTPWYAGESATLDLGPGQHELRAIVSRGLPGRMVSLPGPMVTVEVLG